MTNTTTERTRAVIEGYIEALRTGDVERRTASFAPDATWTLTGSLPTSRTWTGPAEIFGGFLAEMVERFDISKPITQDLRTLVADGEHAVAEWTTRGVTKAGEPYVNDVVIVFRVVDGRIVEAREYFDTEYARRLLW